MSEERLQEIKYSIDLQEKIMTKNMLVDEEKELYDEVVRLTNIINELEKWLNKENGTTIFDYQNAIEDVLNKLQGLKGDSSNGQ